MDNVQSMGILPSPKKILNFIKKIRKWGGFSSTTTNQKVTGGNNWNQNKTESETMKSVIEMIASFTSAIRAPPVVLPSLAFPW